MRVIYKSLSLRVKIAYIYIKKRHRLGCFVHLYPFLYININQFPIMCILCFLPVCIWVSQSEKRILFGACPFPLCHLSKKPHLRGNLKYGARFEVLQLSYAAKIIQWPDAEDNLSDNLFTCHTSNRAASGVNGDIPVVSHHKDAGFRHLVRQDEITFPD